MTGERGPEQLPAFDAEACVRYELEHFVPEIAQSVYRQGTGDFEARYLPSTEIDDRPEPASGNPHFRLRSVDNNVRELLGRWADSAPPDLPQELQALADQAAAAQRAFGPIVVTQANDIAQRAVTAEEVSRQLGPNPLETPRMPNAHEPQFLPGWAIMHTEAGEPLLLVPLPPTLEPQTSRTGAEQTFDIVNLQRLFETNPGLLQQQIIEFHTQAVMGRFANSALHALRMHATPLETIAPAFMTTIANLPEAAQRAYAVQQVQAWVRWMATEAPHGSANFAAQVMQVRGMLDPLPVGRPGEHAPSALHSWITHRQACPAEPAPAQQVAAQLSELYTNLNGLEPYNPPPEERSPAEVLADPLRFAVFAPEVNRHAEEHQAAAAEHMRQAQFVERVIGMGGVEEFQQALATEFPDAAAALQELQGALLQTDGRDGLTLVLDTVSLAIRQTLGTLHISSLWSTISAVLYGEMHYAQAEAPGIATENMQLRIAEDSPLLFALPLLAVVTARAAMGDESPYQVSKINTFLVSGFQAGLEQQAKTTRDLTDRAARDQVTWSVFKERAAIIDTDLQILNTELVRQGEQESPSSRRLYATLFNAVELARQGRLDMGVAANWELLKQVFAADQEAVAAIERVRQRLTVVQG